MTGRHGERGKRPGQGAKNLVGKNGSLGRKDRMNSDVRNRHDEREKSRKASLERHEKLPRLFKEDRLAFARMPRAPVLRSPARGGTEGGGAPGASLRPFVSNHGFFTTKQELCRNRGAFWRGIPFAFSNFLSLLPAS